MGHPVEQFMNTTNSFFLSFALMNKGLISFNINLVFQLFKHTDGVPYMHLYIPLNQNINPTTTTSHCFIDVDS